MTHTKTDEMIAEEFAREYAKDQAEGGILFTEMIRSVFKLGFLAGIAHQKKKADNLVSALNDIRNKTILWPKESAAEYLRTVHAMSAQALAAYHEAGVEK